MRQLVRDQLAAARALRLELVAAEEHMLADREGVGAERRALLRGGFAGVYPDIAEIQRRTAAP